MQRRRNRRARLATGAFMALTISLVAAGCGDDGSDDATADGPVTLTIATFNEFGYEDLIEEYNSMQDDVVVEQKKVGTWDDAKENLYTKLAAGSGLSDIEAIEGDAMPAILAESGAFVDLTDPELEGRWLDWKAAAGTDADGKMIGYGTDAGPEGICYRADLFKKAGLPTAREDVVDLMGTWDDYFATGEEFVKAVPGTAWYDSSGGTAQAMLNQVENPFEADDNTINVENPELEAVYASITGNVEKGLSTTLPQWSEDWTAAFQNDGFATMACPGWMLGVVSGNADGVEGWDFADVFPGGGGNWGGSFLTVPTQSEHPERGQGVRGVDHRAGAAGQGLRGDRRLPEPGGGTRRSRGRRHDQRVLQQRPHRRDPVQPGGRDHRAALQGSEVLRHPAGLPGRAAAGGRRDEHAGGVLGHLPRRRERAVLIAPR